MTEEKNISEFSDLELRAMKGDLYERAEEIKVQSSESIKKISNTLGAILKEQAKRAEKSDGEATKVEKKK